MPELVCPKCGLDKPVPSKYVGKKVKCPQCGHIVLVGGVPPVPARSTVTEDDIRVQVGLKIVSASIVVGFCAYVLWLLAVSWIMYSASAAQSRSAGFSGRSDYEAAARSARRKRAFQSALIITAGLATVGHISTAVAGWFTVGKSRKVFQAPQWLVGAAALSIAAIAGVCLMFLIVGMATKRETVEAMMRFMVTLASTLYTTSFAAFAAYLTSAKPEYRDGLRGFPLYYFGVASGSIIGTIVVVHFVPSDYGTILKVIGMVVLGVLHFAVAHFMTRGALKLVVSANSDD